MEEFIAVKGIKALGNQLTTDKIKQVELLESLPYEAPIIEEVEVNEEEVVDNKTKEEEVVDNKTKEEEDDSEGQTKLF